jgi:hypothetical protein
MVKLAPMGAGGVTGGGRGRCQDESVRPEIIAKEIVWRFSHGGKAMFRFALGSTG